MIYALTPTAAFFAGCLVGIALIVLPSLFLVVLAVKNAQNCPEEPFSNILEMDPRAR